MTRELAMTSARARRVPVPAVEPLIGRDTYDYADAFTIQLRQSDARSAEEFARCALEQAAASPLLGRAVIVARRPDPTGADVVALR